MKLQIDTFTRRVRIEEEVNLYRLFEIINAVFPDKSWVDFTIESSPIVANEWVNPIVIDGIVHNIDTNHPWVKKKSFSTTGEGVYNVEVNNLETITN